MSKKKSIKRYIFTVLICIVGAVLSFCQFDIPFTNYTYNGFINSIKLGLDLKGGVSAVYNTKQLEEGDLSEQLKATADRLVDLLTNKGYTEATVTTQGSSQIRVEVPDVDDPETLLTLIETPDILEIKTEESLEAEAKLTGRNIKSATYAFQDNQHGVSVDFDSEGAIIFKDLTTNYEQLYIYLGSNLISSPKVNEPITGGKTFISGSFQTQSEAEAFALKILSGTYPLQLVVDSITHVPATLGENAGTLSLIAGAIALLLIFIIMIVMYRHLGLIANLALILYTFILLFLLQAVPMVQLTLPGIAGIILSIGMAIDGNIIIFQRIKEEYASGKKIPLSFNIGYKKSVSAILDGQITTIIAAVVLALLGTGPIKGFAIVLGLGILVSLFTSLVVTKLLLNLYLPLNSTDPKKLGLKREEATNELN